VEEEKLVKRIVEEEKILKQSVGENCYKYKYPNVALFYTLGNLKRRFSIYFS